jgi:ABC-2 type transport system ATP-binding protein
MSLISVNDISYSVEGKPILNHISLSIEKGDVMALIGHNGSGKTTLLECILEHTRPSSGKVVWTQEPIKKGVMLDSMGFLQLMKVKEIIHYFTVIHKLTSTANIQALIHDFELIELQEQVIRKLSLGERKKLSLLLTLLHDPDIVFMDEPFAGIDPLITGALMRHILKPGRTVIFSTNEWEYAEKYAQKIIMIKSGRIVGEVLSPEQLNKLLPSNEKIITEYSKELLEAVVNTEHYIKDNQIHWFSKSKNETLKLILKYTRNISITNAGLSDYYLLNH